VRELAVIQVPALLVFYPLLAEPAFLLKFGLIVKNVVRLYIF